MLPARSVPGLRRPRRLVASVAAASCLLAALGCSAEPDPPGPDGGLAEGPSETTDPDPSCRGAARLSPRLDRLERQEGVLLGVHALDTGTLQEVGHRADERFAFAATIKAPLAAVVLDRYSLGQLDRRVRWSAADLVTYSPVTSQHVDDGLTIRELIDAAVTVSDNTAANLLLDLVGGPAALDRALADLGDTTTVVADREPELNDVRPGETRNTSTPRAMATTLAEVLVGDALGAADRRVLASALRRNTTGDDLVRAVVPSGWEVGDRTGSAAYGTRNVLAVVTPPGEAPIVLAVMSRYAEPDAAPDDAVVAVAARLALRSLCVLP